MEDKLTKGKTTVFLGAVPGVGKTYAMLEYAQERKLQGANVVIGWIGEYKSKDIKHLSRGIPLIPAKKSDDESLYYLEMDIDTILERKPQLVIVDNLAHENSPGSRHTYRYQDIEELLQNGIDVLTTLNIYNIESQKDLVEQITGIKVKKTVPDRILEAADQIKLIDVSPEELFLRIKEGSVFLPGDIEQSLDEFFRPGNINALRELALRYTAQRVDRQLDQYMQEHHINGPWPATERILACIGLSPFSEQVIRAARRMASALRAELVAVYVDTHNRSPRDESGYNQLDRNLRLAEELGAEVITINGQDIADEIIALIKRKNITQIVIGKPQHFRLLDLWEGSIVDKIIRKSQGINIHLIPGKKNQIKSKSVFKFPENKQASLPPYFFTAILVFIITVLNKFLGLDLVNITMLYLLPVLISAANWGRGPSVLASLLGVFSLDIFFVPPVLSISVTDFRYFISFAVFFLVAVITGNMANRLRNQADIARRRETRTSSLYALSRKIVAKNELDSILKVVENVVSETIDGEAVILLPDNKGNLIQYTDTRCSCFDLLNDEKDVSLWVFKNGLPAGNGTETIKHAHLLYIPLRIEEKNIGVLAIKPSASAQPSSIELRHLLEAFANLSALAVLSMQLADEAQQARTLKLSEELRTALFNSLSHEIRTPLASIRGAVTSLLEDDALLNPADKKILLQTINESTLRMNHLVGNLLDMARLESGMIKLNTEWGHIQEIVGVALRHMQPLLLKRPVITKIPHNLPLVKVDFKLIEQVLINLLDNAIKYSPQDSEIVISMNQQANEILLAVQNTGNTIPEIDRDKIFNMFYRIYSPERVGGTGLGLSICKGIIEAHNGKIWVDSTPDGKSIFKFTIPICEDEPGFIPMEKEGIDDAR